MIIPLDTSPDAFAIQARLLRQRSPTERLRLAMELCDDMRALCFAGVRRRHPEFDEAQVRREFARIVLEVAPGLS